MKTDTKLKLIEAIMADGDASGDASPRQTACEISGQHIVVLDRGFVYVGEVEINGEFVVITKAKNIRYWGTKNGLGELRNGPLKETKLDEIGEVIAPMRALIHLVPCKGF